MQTKKSREVELERNKPTFFLLGLAVACAIVLSAFEWRTPVDERSSTPDCTLEVSIFEATIIPPSFREKEKPVEKKEEVKHDLAKTIIDRFKYDETVPLKKVLKFPDLGNEPIFKDIARLPEPAIDEEPIFIADVMPEFPGGDSARVAFLQNQVVYPQMAKRAGISGKVHVGFTVRKDGTITDIKVMRKVGGGLDEEAIKAVEAMPKWNPGFHQGRPVSVSFVMPVTFSLK
ncbi:energy transducer TonB [Cryomorphaceae bacterium 1068]|nr:energy transducer TonB [Cryomorphaceae bacterium 1068]